MKKFKIFLVDDERQDGGTFHVSNDIVTSNAQRKPLPHNPDGWEDISIGWERDMSKFGLVRNFSLQFGFVLEGATILRSIFYKQNIDRKVALLITKLGLTIDALKFAWSYGFVYRGELDFSTFEDEDDKVSINIMEGGTSKLLKANEATTYEIKMQDPEAINVYCDGIALKEKLNFAALDGLNYQNPIYTPSFLFVNNEGKSSGVTFISQQFEVVGSLPGQDETYAQDSDNFFLRNDYGTPILANISGTLKIKSSQNGTSPLSSTKIKFKTSKAGGTTEYPLFTVFPTPGVEYSYPINLDLTIDGNEKLFLFGETTSVNAALYNFEFLPDSNLSVTFLSRYKPTYVRMFPLSVFYKRMVGKITGKEADAVSALLEANKNICITCGDAIRGFEDAKAKTKFNDLFDAANIQFNAGLGIESEKIVLEEKGHFFDSSNPIPLGEVKVLKKSLARELMLNSIKIGSEPKDYEDLNGRDEINNVYTYGSEIKRIKTELTLVSPYRRDSYGFEFARINLAGKETTDSGSDNDIWLVNVADNVPYDYVLYNGTFEATAPNIIKIPIPFLSVGTEIVISGAAANNGTYAVTNVSYLVVGYTYITVSGVFTSSTGTGNITTSGIAGYALKRETYDSISGLISPDTVFNIEDMTVRRLIEKHGNWIRSMMWGFDNTYLDFRTTDKNRELRTEKSGVVYDEDENILVSDLAAPLFIPIFIEVEPTVPIDLVDQLAANPSRCFSFIDKGVTYKGYLIKGGIAIGDNSKQIFKLLLTADNNLQNFIH